MFNPRDPDSYRVFHMLGKETPVPQHPQERQIADCKALVYGAARIDPDLLQLVFKVAGVEATAEQQKKIGVLMQAAMAEQANRTLGQQVGDDKLKGKVCEALVCGNAHIDSNLLRSVFEDAGAVVTAEQQETIGCLMQAAMADQADRMLGQRARNEAIRQILIRNAPRNE